MLEFLSDESYILNFAASSRIRVHSMTFADNLLSLQFLF